MKEVIGLKDFGQWCRKGQKREINNKLALSMSRKGIVRITKDLGNYPYSPIYLRRCISSMRRQVNILRIKINRYEKMLLSMTGGSERTRRNKMKKERRCKNELPKMWYEVGFL